MQRWHKTSLVVVGAIVFSTVAIQASDIVRSIDGNMVGLALDNGSICGPGATEVYLGSGALCVDLYEAAASKDCADADPDNETQTQNNVNDVACHAVSEEGREPWRYVSLPQAQQLCARTGKRLPNNDEWYALVSAMGDQTSCNTTGPGVRATGAQQCTTYAGVYDMVGNLWEWVDGQVVDGQYNDRPVPGSGYVQLVDADGVVLETGTKEREEYGGDYATTDSVGIYGMVRGGFYGSEEDAGLYAQNLSVPLNLKAPGVGFRCVRTI